VLDQTFQTSSKPLSTPDWIERGYKILVTIEKTPFEVFSSFHFLFKITNLIAAVVWVIAGKTMEKISQIKQ